MVKVAGAVEFADRLDQAVLDGVSLLALTIDERTIILAQLEDPPDDLAELRAFAAERAPVAAARRARP